MFNIHLCVLVAGLCVLASCHHVPGHQGGHDGHEHAQEDQPPPKSKEESGLSSYPKIAPSALEFTLQFYHQVHSKADGKNILFSSLSIATAFILVSLGAKGSTLDQIVSGLCYNQSVTSMQEIDDYFHHLIQWLNHPEAKLHLGIGSALFTADQFQVQQEVLNKARDLFQAEIVPTNFKNAEEAVAQINSYIERKTHGKLVDVVQGLDPEIAMVLVNYIYMKADWKKPFNPKFTQKKDFFVDNETTVQVDMMYRDGYYLIYRDVELNCEVVQIPFQGNASALFILPQKGKLHQVEQALRREVFLKWKASLKLRRIKLSLPKVTLSSSIDVKEALRGLGVTEVFTDQADLSGFTGHPNLKISKAIHKAYLNIHENGTEAAAATFMRISTYSITFNITFNRPFLLTFYSKTADVPLLVGRLMNPNEPQAHS